MVSPLSGGNNMSKALKCDRYGKKYGKCKHFYYMHTSFFNAPDSCVDLCPECYGKLKKWMEGNEIDS